MKHLITIVAIVLGFTMFLSGCFLQDEEPTQKTETIVDPNKVDPYSLYPIDYSIQYRTINEEGANTQKPSDYHNLPELKAMAWFNHMYHPKKIYIANNTLYLTDLHMGLHIFDITNPATPEEISYYPIRNGEDVAMKAHYLYADDGVDLKVFDVENPKEITLKNYVSDVITYACNYDWRGYAWNDYDAMYYYPEDDNRIWAAQGPKYRWGVKNDYDLGISSCDDYYGRYYYGYMDDKAVETGAPTNDTAGGSGGAGSTARMLVVGDYLYWVTCQSEIVVLSLKNPELPVKVNSITDFWGMETIFAAGNLLFIGKNNGMSIYDISEDPSKPVHIGEFSHAQSCDPVYVEGNLAYVTLRSNGSCWNGNLDELQVVDISDPTNPTLIGTYSETLVHPYGLAIDENHAFICDGEDGLKVLDVTDATAIKPISAVPDIQVNDVVLYNWNAYLVGNKGLNVYNFENIENLTFQSSIPAQGTVDSSTDLIKNGQYIYSITGFRTLAVYDTLTFPLEKVSSIENRYFENFIPKSGTSNHLYAWKGVEYTNSDWGGGVYYYPLDYSTYASNGFDIIDVSNPSAPAVAGEYLDGNMRSAIMTDDYGYVLCRISNGDKKEVYTEEWQLKVLDVSSNDPSVTSVIDLKGLTTNVYGERSQKTVTYNYDYSGVYEDTVTDPKEGSSGTSDGDAADSTNETKVDEVPSEVPVEEYSYTYDCLKTKGKFNSSMYYSYDQPMVIVDHVLYIGIPGDGILVFDLSAKAEPELTTVFKHEHQIIDLLAYSGYLFVLDEEGVKSIDISNPLEPQLLNKLQVGWMEDLAIFGNEMYVSGTWAGLVKLDISQPTQMIEVGTSPIDQITEVLSVDDTGVWCSSLEKGVINLNGLMQ